ncbi:DUF4804 domain-containing protein [bacterium]|nr:MAG: DUF4804 domain-containing protein [bacterium]QQR62096.1 MAG: DUF4804 domain-containing protein [bacterium]QQR63347.1 MAG: DUF4804 domain-containing protein [bacterium]
MFEGFINFLTSVGNLIGSAATTVARTIRVVALSIFFSQNSDNQKKPPVVKTEIEEVVNVDQQKQQQEEQQKQERLKKAQLEEKRLKQEQQLKEEKEAQEQQRLAEERRLAEEQKQKDEQEAERLEQERLAKLPQSTKEFNAIIQTIQKSGINDLLQGNNHPQRYLKKLPENRSAQFEKDFVAAYKAQELVYDNRLNDLIADFLGYIKRYGSDEEKNFFKTFTNKASKEWIFRLFEARNLTYLWNLGALYIRAKDPQYERTDNDPAVIARFKKDYNPLKDYITDEEQLLSPFVSVFGPTFFINDGARSNKAEFKANFDENDNCITKGYHAGLVGPSFERANNLEYRHMIITKEQNTTENGYGNKRNEGSKEAALNKIFEDFYELKTPFKTFDQACDDLNENPKQEDLIVLNPWQENRDEQIIFSRSLYEKRIKAVIVPFLDKVEKTAQSLKKQAILYTVGLGLGTWTKLPGDSTSCQLQNIPQESKIKSFINTYFDIKDTETTVNTLTLLGTCIQIEIYKKWFEQNKEKKMISDLVFGYMGWDSTFEEFQLNRKIFDNSEELLKKETVDKGFKINCGLWGSTNIICSTLNPSSNRFSTPEDQQNKIQVCAYAWDGNSFPGNEYWKGQGFLTWSGDPAAMASSLSPVLQNPMTNDTFQQKAKTGD